MKLEEVLPAYREGKKIRREKWNEGYVHTRYENELVRFYSDDIDATDWSIVEDPITITREQFEKAVCKVFNAAIINVETFDRLWAELKK